MSKTPTHGLWIGPKTIAQMDGRRTIVKCFKDVKRQISNALGADLSPQQEILVDRVVFMLFKTTTFEALSMKTQGPNPAVDAYYLSWVNTLRRTLEALGLKRIPHDAQTLAGQLASLAEEGDGSLETVQDGELP